MIKEIPNKLGYFLDEQGNFYSSRIHKGRNGHVVGDDLKKMNGSVGKNGYVLVSLGKERKSLHRLMLEV